MQYITPPQNRRLHQLVNQAKIHEEDKRALIHEFTNGKSTSSKDLLKDQAQHLIQHLEEKLDLVATAPTIEQEVASDKMRRKILSLSHEMRWYLPGTGKVDMKRVNDWCQARGFGKKVLNQYTHDELTKLVFQFKKVYSTYLLDLAK
jgi:polyhydroxyalkanoate synthesis regulator phasin